MLNSLNLKIKSMKVINNEELNINENDVLNEFDVDILKQWELSIEKQMHDARSKILSDNLKYKNNEYVDDISFMKAKGFIGSQYILKNIISDRIKKVNRDNSEIKRKEFENSLLTRLKEYVGEEVFLKMVRDVKSNQ